MRASLVTLVGAVATTLAIAGCKQGGASDQPLPSRELETARATIADAELDIKLPKGARPLAPAAGAPPPVAGQGEARWELASGGDVLSVMVQLASPTPMQNATNFEEAAGRRLGRSEQTADGWSVTSYHPEGSYLHARRMIEKNGRALFCQASATWAKPGHDAKRTEYVESICQSMTPTKL